MAIESVSSVGSIEREEGTDLSISGLFQALNRRNYESHPSFSQLGKLTIPELRTVASQASNIQAAVISGLRTVGDLASSFDPSAGGFDHLGVGWLVKHLTETLEAVMEIDSSACSQLAARGYGVDGKPIRQHA
jgi:hypothetical protein